MNGRLLLIQDSLLGLVCLLFICVGIYNVAYTVQSSEHLFELAIFYFFYFVLSLLLIASILLRFYKAYFSSGIVLSIMLSTVILGSIIIWGGLFLYSWLCLMLLIMLAIIILNPRYSVTISSSFVFVCLFCALLIRPINVSQIYVFNLMDLVIVGTIMFVWIGSIYTIRQEVDTKDSRLASITTQVLNTHQVFMTRSMESMYRRKGKLEKVSELDFIEALLSQASYITNKGIMLSSLIHELDNKLIPLFAELNDRSILRRKEYVGAMNGVMSVMERIHNHEDEKRALTKFGMIEATYKIIDLLRFRYPSVTVNLKASCDEIIILSSRMLFDQVIVNLLDNAFKAALSAKKPNVRLEFELSRKQVHMLISNNGETIPMNRINSFFNPGVSSKMGGSGMGLYVSRYIAKEIGGDIDPDYSSEGWQGFSFTLSRGQV